MKKGCFLKFIIIFTIVLAVILYLVQNKFNELILNPGKELALSVIEKNWEKDLNYIKESSEKDSLKSLLKFYISNSKSAEKLLDDNSAVIIDYLNGSFIDSVIDKNELTHINKLITDALNNEQ